MTGIQRVPKPETMLFTTGEDALEAFETTEWIQTDYVAEVRR